MLSRFRECRCGLVAGAGIHHQNRRRRGLWRKAKALNRQEFVVIGWSDPEGSRPHLGALLLGYYTDDSKLIYAGRVGTGMPVKVLADLRRRLDPLARKTSPLNVLTHKLSDWPECVIELQC